MGALDLKAVRRLARAEGLKESYYNETSRVVSLARPGEEVDRVRFNVYYSTGTVGTCINHPQQGRTQLFRRNVVSLEQLRDIFRNPRLHTGTGYHRRTNKKTTSSEGSRPDAQRLKVVGGNNRTPSSRLNFPVGSRAYVKGFANCTVHSNVLSGYDSYAGKVRVRYDDGTMYHVDPDQLEEVMEEVVEEETAAKEQMQLLTQEKVRLMEELKLLDEQVSDVQIILDDFEEKRRQQAEAERLEKERKATAASKKAEAELIRQKKAKQEQERNERGSCLSLSLADGNFISESFDKTVTCISCGGSSTIMLYENGGWRCSSGLTTHLYNKLNGRQKSLPDPTYVSIGSQDRYYVRFADGKYAWVGCDAMPNALNDPSRSVKTVAFGMNWETYFVVYNDGSWCWNGSIPQELADLLNKRQKRSDLACVSLGPKGEWYVAAKNGRAWWGGMSTKALKHVRKYNDRLTFLDFGHDDAYLFRYY